MYQSSEASFVCLYLGCQLAVNYHHTYTIQVGLHRNPSYYNGMYSVLLTHLIMAGNDMGRKCNLVIQKRI